MLTYYIKCRENIKNLNSKIFKIKNMRLIKLLKCAKCGVKKSRSVKGQEA